MNTDYVQVYSLDDITKRYQNILTDKRLTIFDIGPKHNRYFVVDRPYQFNVFGIILITRGQCEITINFEPMVVKKDDLLVVLSNQLFEIKKYSEDFTVKTLFVDGDLFLEAGFHIKSNNLIQFLASQYPKIISLDKTVISKIRNTLKQLSKLTYKNEHLFGKDLILSYFSILMYDLGDYYNKTILIQNRTKQLRKEETTKTFLYLVATHFKKEHSVQFYADQMFISRKHLTKTITEVFKKTPKQIISETLILEAKVLLRNPRLSISDIITELSFQDLSVFSKFFKSHTGASPTEFKNNN